MKLFKRNKQLLARIESLENQLGYVYSIDTDGYVCHQLTRGSYSDMAKALDGLKDIQSASKKAGK